MVNNAFSETVLDGSLIAAAPIAVLAGLISFLSPCVLPLVPGYLGYMSGLSGTALEGKHRGRMVTAASLFVLGFALVFILVTILFTQVFFWLQRDGQWLTQVLGVVVILMGLVFMGAFGWFQKERRIEVKPAAGLLGAPFLGMTFGLGWAPCLGPTMTAIIALSVSGEESLGRAGLLAFLYCLGLGLPFVLIAFGVQRGLRAMAFFRRHRVLIMRLGGALLIVLGLVMATGLWTAWMAHLQLWFANDVRMPL
ncbi:MAG: cytochrome c biogenesis protein CcdA [Micrococcus sp.]|nr:cytochrome c biogenesis protein CcdA [Micrococcus sp.]